MRSDKNPSIDTAEGATKFAREWLAAARQAFELSGALMPMTVVIVTRPSPTFCVIPGDLFFTKGGPGKEAYFNTVRQVAERGEAIGVLTIIEAWAFVGRKYQSKESIDAEITKYGGLEKHPKRKEQVVALFQHKALGVVSWTASIIREGDKARLAAYRKHVEVEGRLADLLPRPTMAN